ncbi:Protein Y43F8C.13 [Aphelenchoides avenae]|nr:Protein Y43F8C.13 [Aphelenchus avenae]
MSFIRLAFILTAFVCATHEAVKEIVIDSDGVTDDVQALSLALQHPSIKVLAVTTSSGSTNSSQAAANVARTLRANGKKGVPIYKGAERTLTGGVIDYTFTREYFGTDGLGDTPNAFPKVLPSDAHAYVAGKTAAQALVDIFRTRKGVTLVVTGPLTNIALALDLEPRFAEWPAKVVLMGGNVYAFGNMITESTAESNFFTDPEAAYTVLKSMKCPITLVTWESALFEGENHTIDFYSHLNDNAPLADFFRTATKAPIAFTEKSNSSIQYLFCDQITVGTLIDEEGVILQKQYRRAAVETKGQFTRGQVAIDWTQRSNGVTYDGSRYNDYRPITFVTKSTPGD